MIRAIRRYFAIRAYTKRLSGDLRRRFGLKPFYTIDHVTKAVERGGYTKAFIAYAHATYCSREDFDAYYGPLGVKCTFDGLRAVIAKRYLKSRMDFDAETVMRTVRLITIAGGPFQTEESEAAEPFL